MSLACFFDTNNKPNLITLRGVCDEITPVSGLYANDLPLVSLNRLDGLADDEKKDLQGLYESIYRRSLNMLRADFVVHASKYFKASLLLDNQQSHRYRDTLESVSSSANYKGVAVRVEGTKYMELIVNSIQLYVTASATATIKIFDYQDGTELYTGSHTVTKGHNRVELNQSFLLNGHTKRFFICYDATSINSQKTTSSVYGDPESHLITVKGGSVGTGTSVTESNITFAGDTGGLIANFSVGCSHDAVMCENRQLLAHSLWYLIGRNIAQESLTSDLINEYTMINTEKIEEIQVELTDMYKESLNKVLDNITPQGDLICLPCEKVRSYGRMTP